MCEKLGERETEREKERARRSKLPRACGKFTYAGVDVDFRPVYL